MSDNLHDRDIVATNEMINTLRAGTFRKYAFGSAAVLAVLFAGTALVVWAAKSGNDPEHLKEALRHMPPLEVVVKVDPNSSIKLADGGMVKIDPSSTVRIADGGTVALEQGSLLPRAAMERGGGSHDPAIQTSVTVFKTVSYGEGTVETGWRFPNGAAKSPEAQFCHYKQNVGDGGWGVQNIGRNGEILPAPKGVSDQRERFTKCQWFSGSVG